jgi:hypothetical protein
VIAFAYPLALPLPLLALGVFLGNDRRSRGKPFFPRMKDRGPKKLLWLLPLIVLLAGPLRGIFDKLDTAQRLILLGHSLRNWGGDLSQFYPERWFLGLDDSGMAAIGLPLLAYGTYRALRATPKEIRWGLGSLLLFGLISALYFRTRQYGWYFHFKALAYVGPIAVTIAAVGLSKLRMQWISIAIAIFLVAGFRNGAAHELSQTFDQLPKDLLALQAADAALPESASIRLDMKADGRQLWAGFLLSHHPLCSQSPLLHTSYPHVPISRAADYVLAEKELIKPFDAEGPLIHTYGGYDLYKLKPGLGKSYCSREMVQTVESVR